MDRRSTGWVAALALGLAACTAPQEPAPPAQNLGGGGGGGGGDTETETEWPLLDGARGGNFATRFCEGKGDDAVLPADPRTLIKPGVNAGKAVAFNAFWTDCTGAKDNHVTERPVTCGEFRAQAVHGWFIGEGQGEIGTPMTFGGGQTPEQQSGLDAALYNRLWEVWGMTKRPENFDELVAERYGSPQTPATLRNPYPLPHEIGTEAARQNGGSGQLPLIFTQLRNADGTWKGQIGTKVCLQCHNGQLGTEADGPGMGPQLGGAGSIGDFTVQGYEFDEAAALQDGESNPLSDLAEEYFVMPSPTSAITISTNRGTGAIDFFQLAYVLFSNGDPELLANEKIVASQAIGNIKSPPWWNLAYRTQKFHGAVLPTDSARIDLAAYYNLTKGMQDGMMENFGYEVPEGQKAIDWVDDNAGEFQTWAEAQASPEMPLGFCPSTDGKPCIDKAMAEAGATLFHTLNLWADGLDNPVARPAEGNGSCASCHGAYSPRYTHDPAFLDSPDLAGIAAYTVPMAIVGTDPVYADAMQSIRQPDGTTSDSVMNQDVTYCGLGNSGSSGYQDEDVPGALGYHKVSILLAPPLWGIWASAPYFHNGSVPNIWGVLDPAHERPALWKRVSTPTPPPAVTGLDAADQAKIVMGYDTDLWRAYDFEKLGWKYEEVTCAQSTTQPALTCSPVEAVPNPVQLLLNQLYTQFGATWNLPRYEGLNGTQQDIENRKVFNTHLYSQGNQGHAFTAVLTDAQRRMIIEYLKTL